MTFKISFTLITMTGREGANADQGATKVVDNSSEAEDDDIDSKHINAAGGMMILMMNMVWLMRGRHRSRMLCY